MENGNEVRVIKIPNGRYMEIYDNRGQLVLKRERVGNSTTTEWINNNEVMERITLGANTVLTTKYKSGKESKQLFVVPENLD